MHTYRVLSINVGKPREVAYQNKMISTAIWKASTPQPIMLTSTNLEGDGQADIVNHGGTDMAVLLYSYDHYDYWEQQLNRKLEYGAFGENITVIGLTEHDVCIGDILEWGEAIIQISQPRYPCYKLSIRHEAPTIPQLVLDTGFSGYYARVLQPGLVSTQSELNRIQQHPSGISIAAVSEAFSNKGTPTEIVRGIVAVDELSESWKKKFESRIT